jgi:hypothetical protein
MNPMVLPTAPAAAAMPPLLPLPPTTTPLTMLLCFKLSLSISASAAASDFFCRACCSLAASSLAAFSASRAALTTSF